MKGTVSLAKICLALCLAASVVGAADSPPIGINFVDQLNNCASLPAEKAAIPGAAAAPDPCVPVPPPSTCNGTPGEWAGCRGNGCAVCSELVASEPLYFQNHPLCSPNETCGGLYFTCNENCPAPTCNGTPGEWAGCRGNGCAVCSELVAGYPYYFENHPLCSPNETCGGLYFTCNAVCPSPTPDDMCDEPGDVNLNGIPGEIADAVLLNNFLGCLTDLTPEEIANSDVIADCLVDQADADCLMDPDCVIQVCDCPEPEVTACRCSSPGDVNLNGVPGDIGDAVLLNHFLGCTAELTPEQITNSDVTGDCLVDQADADCLGDSLCEIQACVCGEPEVTGCRCTTPGDVNLNGIPGDIGDAVLLNHFLDCQAELTSEQITNSDVTGDCVVSQADADCLVGICEIQACVCPDPEYPIFSPGDVNSNGIVADIADLVYLNNFLCSGGPAPDPLANGDVDGDCDIDSADSARLLDIITNGGDPEECACGLPTVIYCE